MIDTTGRSLFRIQLASVPHNNPLNLGNLCVVLILSNQIAREVISFCAGWGSSWSCPVPSLLSSGWPVRCTTISRMIDSVDQLFCTLMGIWPLCRQR
jgi:hypothetical protein